MHPIVYKGISVADRVWRGSAHVPVLMYHRVTDSVASPLSVSSETFRLQMRELHAAGYRTISCRMLQRAMDEGAALPPHPVLVTFDDGFQDNVSNAAPILAEFGYSGTVFVATAYIGGTAQFCSREVDRQAPMLTGDDIARLENEYDWDVAHHFHSHRKLTDLSAQEIQSELASAQEVLRQYIAKTENVSYCAVPKDVMNETVRSTLRDDDATRLAFAGKGLAQRSSDMFGVPRVEIHNDQCGSDFLVRLSPTFQAMRAVKARM